MEAWADLPTAPPMFISHAQCRQTIPPPRAFEQWPSPWRDESICSNFFGFRSGPPFRLRLSMMDVCVSPDREVLDHSHEFNTSWRSLGSTLRCVIEPRSSNVLICEASQIRLGQHIVSSGEVMPPLRASCMWARDHPQLSALRSRPSPPWDHSNIRLPTSMEPPLSGLIMRLGKELHQDDGRPVTRVGFEELFNSVHVSNKTGSGSTCGPNDRFVKHTVVLVRRGDAFNPFHAHETLWAVWSTFLAFDLDPCDTGILFSDNLDDTHASGPFLEFHRTVFAPIHGVEKMSELTMMDRPTCYKRLITSITPELHFGVPYNRPVSSTKNVADCGASPWLIGFTHFARAGFGLYEGARPWRRVPQVTLLNRQPYRREVHSAQPYATMRTMRNLPELEDGLARFCHRSSATALSNASSNTDASSSPQPRLCTHSTLDLATLPITTQVAMATATDVLVGTHSAALTFLLYLPPHACVVEFPTQTDFHYDNLASYIGRCHLRYGNSKTQYMKHNAASWAVNVSLAVSSVQAALRSVAPSAELFRQRGFALPNLPARMPRSLSWPVVNLPPTKQSAKQSSAKQRLRIAQSSHPSSPIVQ